MKLTGLSYKIAWAMMSLTLVSTFLVTISSYLFYYLWLTYWPEYFPSNGWLYPTGIEWAWLIFTVFIALVISTLMAIRLAKKILVPLNSVIEGINLVSKGNLETRAITSDESSDEISELVFNFNELAENLEKMTKEQSFWNAAIAHELRTPVTILKGRLQGLVDGVFEPDRQLFINLATQIDSLIRVIDDLRVVSLAENGHLDLHKHKINLYCEIEEAIDMFKDKLKIGGKNIITSISSEYVYCDPIRIRQIVLALLDNCLKYSKEGNIYIETKIHDGNYFLSVDDEGPGISDEFIPHVFTAFRREKKFCEKGSGLGLAVVASIAKAHGGKAACYPNNKGGTKFQISWPVK